MSKALKEIPDLSQKNGLESPNAKIIEMYSTETETPPNEKHINVKKQRAFEFTNDDLDTAST